MKRLNMITGRRGGFIFLAGTWPGEALPPRALDLLPGTILQRFRQMGRLNFRRPGQVGDRAGQLQHAME